jgi:hypothetical protein
VLRRRGSGPLLAEFESDLVKVPGVKSARVVGNGEPSEIHIVASSERTPKQLVRDVQSLAMAGYQLSIDHRIVSVVQLEEDKPAEAASSNGHSSNGNRPIISYIIAVNDEYGRRVDLGIKWPDGTSSGGVGQLGASRQGRARAGADAMVQAVNIKLGEAGMSADLDHVFLVAASDGAEVVTVRLSLSEGGRYQMLLGSANSDGDLVAGAARATLHALNRKLSTL